MPQMYLKPILATTRRSYFLRLLLLSLFLIGCAEQQTETQTPATTEQQANTLGLDLDTLSGIASQAYLYGLPAAEIARLRSIPAFTGNGTARAQRNRFAHLRNIIPAGTGTCCPNQDTLYSLAWLDLSEEPLVLNIPATEGRYFIAHITDILTRNRPALSRRTIGSDGGKYLLTGLNWDGETPEGVTPYPLGSNEGLILLRISPRNPDDITNVNKLQDLITLTHPSGREVSQELYVAHDVEDPFEVYKWTDHVLRNNPFRGRDEGIINTLGLMGLGDETPFDTDGLSDAEKDILLTVKKSNDAMLQRHLANVGANRNGWSFLVPGNHFEHDILTRAAIAVAYILPNDESEAMYPIAMTDSEGRPLNSNHSYKIVFDSAVPAQAFWSLTAYDYPGVHLIKNEHEKYAVGDRTEGLKNSISGGTEILISKNKPAKNHANWLPVPSGDFAIVLRLYEPTDAVINGSWNPPSIVRID